MRLLKCSLASALIALSMGASASASVLTFDITDDMNPLYAGTDDFPEGYRVDDNYGDRITGPTGTNGTVDFAYGVGAEGYTPNVTVEYGPFSLLSGGPELWRFDYGDLDRVLYQGSRGTVGTNYNILEIVLTADPGFNVELYGFDLGGWNRTDYTINAVTVFDGVPFPVITPTNDIFNESNVLVEGDGLGPQHTSFNFSTPLVSNKIWIRIDANNLGDDSELIGIDNIRFGQVVADDTGVVPEPMSLLVWSALAAAGVVGYRRNA